MAGYTRQSSFSDGDTITAALFNNEYNQLVNAFNVSSGHTHDGSTTGDGGPISTLFSNTLTFGTNAESDIAITFNAASNDGVLTWKEDEDYFEFSDDLLIATTEKIQFRDTAIYINSSTDGQLDLVADTEIQIAATTVDINGNADISGNLGIGGNLTVTGTTTFNGGTITMGDAATDNVVFGANVDSNIIPDDDNTYDLGSSSQEWKDLYVDGIAYLDGINFNGTAITSTAAELNILDGVTSTAAELNILDGVTSTTAELNILDGVTSTATEINLLDGSTANTVVNSKAVIYGSSGELAGTLSTAAQTNITTVGTLTTLTVDDITINGSTISDGGALSITSGGDFTVDSEDDIILDANGADIRFKDNGTSIGTFSNSSSDFVITSEVQDKDIIFKGNDNGSSITALTLDMSEAGAATFNNKIIATELDISGDVDIDGTLETDVLSINSTTVTSTAAELNILDGVTSTAAELNILDGVTSTTAELNILDGVTATAAEINVLDGYTGSVTELNYLDTLHATGVTSTEFDFLDGVTSNIQTQLDSKISATLTTEQVQDIVGGMVSSNTETGITVTYEDGDGTLDFVIGTLNQDTTGNAATATALETARTIHGVSFDGTANIDLSEVVQDTVGAMFSSNTETNITATYQDADGTIDLVIGTLNQDTTGNAATATALETARTIHGVSFDGTANIDLSEVIQDTVGAMVSSNTESGITVTYQDSDGTLDFSVASADSTLIVDADGDTKVQVEESSDEDKIRFDTGGTERVIIDSDGIDVTGTVNGMTIEQSGFTCPTSQNFAINSPNGLRINIDSNNDGTTENFVIGNNQTAVDSSNNVLFLVQENGKVAVASTNPNGTFHVGTSNATGDTTNPAIQIGGTSTYRMGLYTSAEGAVIENKNGDDGIQFRVKTAGEAMRIDTSGNVLVGTTTFNNLSTESGVLASNNVLMARGSLADHQDACAVLQYASDATWLRAYGDTSGSGYMIFRAGGGAGATDVEYMRINSTGEVHITSGGSAISPTIKHSGGTGDVAKLRLINRSGQSSNKGGLLELGGITDDGVSRSDVFASIAGLKDNATSGNKAGYMQFMTSNGSSLAEKMRLDSNGKLFLGTTSGVRGAEDFSIDASSDAIVTRTAGAGLIVRKTSFSNGFLCLFENDSATQVGAITSDGSTTNFSASSDYRLKENIEPMQNGLERLNQLNPVKFTWKETGEEAEGFIAHEVDEVFSDCINGEKDGESMQTMDYGRITPLLVKAIQEQQEQINALQSEIKNLKGE